MATQERTEAATPRRREQARRRGQVAKSVELTSAAVLIVAFFALRVLAVYVWPTRQLDGQCDQSVSYHFPLSE